jgi:hypothetical protein
MGIIISTRQFGLLSWLTSGKYRDPKLESMLATELGNYITSKAIAEFKGIGKELFLTITIQPKSNSTWKAVPSYYFNYQTNMYSMQSCKIIIGGGLTVEGVTGENVNIKLSNLLNQSEINAVKKFLVGDLVNLIPSRIMEFTKEYLGSFLATRHLKPSNNSNDSVDDIQRFYNNVISNYKRYPIKGYRLSISKFTRDELVISLDIKLGSTKLLPTYTINPATYQIQMTDCSIKAGAEGDIVENVTPQNWLKRLKEEEDSYVTNEYDEYTTLYQTLNGDKYGKQDLKDMDKFFKQDYNKTIPTFLINTFKQYKQERGL